MKAKITVLKTWITGNLGMEEKVESSEKVEEYILEEGQAIKESMGYEFTISKIEEKSVKFVTNKGISEISERGTINLQSNQKELEVRIGETKEIAPTLTDCSTHWSIKIEEITI